MDWDDSYRYFPTNENGGKVQTPHHYFDSTDDLQTLSAAARRQGRLADPQQHSIFSIFASPVGLVVRLAGWAVVLVLADYLIGLIADAISGRVPHRGERRWGPIMRLLTGMSSAPRMTAPKQAIPEPVSKEHATSRYASPLRASKPHSADSMRAGFNESREDKSFAQPHGLDATFSLKWFISIIGALLRGTGWVLLWVLSVALSAIPRAKRRRGTWSALDQVQRRVDAALKLFTSPNQGELMRRELGQMLQQQHQGNMGAHCNPEMLSRLVSVSQSMLEQQRMEACKEGKLLSPLSSAQRSTVPPHMQFGNRSRPQPASSSNPQGPSSLKEVYDLWDRLLEKGHARSAPYTSGASCLPPTSKDSVASNEALLRELLLQMGHRPQHLGEPPRMSNMLASARSHHTKLSAMLALDGKDTISRPPMASGAVLGEVEAQLQSLVSGGRPQMSHRGPILTSGQQQQPTVAYANPFDGAYPQQQQGCWGAPPQQQQQQQQQQQGWTSQQQFAPQQNGCVPQQQQGNGNFAPTGAPNGQFQGYPQQQQQQGGNPAGGGMGGVFANVGGQGNVNGFGTNPNVFGGNSQQSGNSNNAFTQSSNNNNNVFGGSNGNGNGSNAFAQNNNNNNLFGNNQQNGNNAFAQNGNGHNNAFAQNNNNNNNNVFGGNNQQNGNGNGQNNNAFGQSNNNNNNGNGNGFDAAGSASRGLFGEDLAPTGRATQNGGNFGSENEVFIISPRSTSKGAFQRPPTSTTSPPFSNGGNGFGSTAMGPSRRAAAQCRGNEDVPVFTEVRKARGGVAIEVDMGMGPSNSRPPLGGRGTPAAPRSTTTRGPAATFAARHTSRLQDLADRKLERQSGNAHRVSTPADCGFPQRAGGPGARTGTINYDEVPCGRPN